jgi:hypothetical protein
MYVRVDKLFVVSYSFLSLFSMFGDPVEFLSQPRLECLRNAKKIFSYKGQLPVRDFNQ